MKDQKQARIADFIGKLSGTSVDVDAIVRWVESDGAKLMESLLRHKEEVTIRFNRETFDPHDQVSTLIMGLALPDDLSFVKLALAMGPATYAFCEATVANALMIGYSLALDDSAEFMDDVAGTNKKLTSRVLDLEQEVERLRSKVQEGDAVLGVARRRISTLESERG